MKAIIVNKKINTKDFKYNDVVEIVPNNLKWFGSSIKKVFDVSIDEVVIKKVIKKNDNETVIMTKCYKKDLLLLKKEKDIDE